MIQKQQLPCIKERSTVAPFAPPIPDTGEPLILNHVTQFTPNKSKVFTLLSFTNGMQHRYEDSKATFLSTLIFAYTSTIIFKMTKAEQPLVPVF